jgi:hypothetical protein
MCHWSRFLLIVLLAVGLPIQGWAAARMAAGMAGQALAMQASDAGAGMVEGAGIADMASHHDHACCDTLHNEAQLDHSSNACGDACHCCISVAPGVCMLEVRPDEPRHEWFALSCGPCTTVPPATPDKPPKA